MYGGGGGRGERGAAITTTCRGGGVCHVCVHGREGGREAAAACITHWRDVG